LRVRVLCAAKGELNKNAATKAHKILRGCMRGKVPMNMRITFLQL